ncbi:hypothetical protein [Streptomyces albogriseolus]|uniref:hypothetical protein n=1 Tax=Streptomyces albogriseolus TaxID=1887 RepID=UPI00382C1A91
MTLFFAIVVNALGTDDAARWFEAALRAAQRRREQTATRSVHGLSMPARELLKFSTPRDPAQLAAFIKVRVLNPEHAYWRRGIKDAVIYQRLHGDV